MLLLESGPDDNWTGYTAPNTETGKRQKVEPLVIGDVYLLVYAPDIDDTVMSENIWMTDRHRGRLLPYA